MPNRLGQFTNGETLSADSLNDMVDVLTNLANSKVAKEELEGLKAAIKAMVNNGEYPDHLY